MGTFIIRASAYHVLLLFGWAGTAFALDGSAGPLTLKGNDRVAFLGSALIEHEQDHGYLETRLTQRFPEASVTFRNFGWSGDTVSGTARTSGFQNPAGFARLLKEVRAFRPTVIFIAYGMNESFGGPHGLAGFVKGYAGLLDELGPLKARIIVLSPPSHEDLGRPFPAPAAHNRDLEVYTAALAKIAKERTLRFVDLFHPFVQAHKTRPNQRLTTNGLLPNAMGYRLFARVVEEDLWGGRGSWNIELDRSGKVLKCAGAEVGKAQGSGRGVSVEIKPLLLPPPAVSKPAAEPRLRIAGLAPGSYAIRLNGRELVEASAAEWERGVTLSPDPALAQTEKLRAAIVKKGRLFYRRWRPFNDHSRHWGFIGGDFKLYDAEIAEQERIIAQLRRPAALHFDIVRKEKIR